MSPPSDTPATRSVPAAGRWTRPRQLDVGEVRIGANGPRPPRWVPAAGGWPRPRQRDGGEAGWGGKGPRPRAPPPRGGGGASHDRVHRLLTRGQRHRRGGTEPAEGARERRVRERTELAV